MYHKLERAGGCAHYENDQQSTLYWFLLHYASTLLAHDAGDGNASVEHQALSSGESTALSHIPPKPDQLDRS